ncbi:MAG: hypothetical protein CYG60_09810, partial [Actinobacteria bacterium]
YHALVICTNATPLVCSRVPIWVELYPNCEASSRISIRGETATVEGIELTDVLALLDLVGTTIVEKH